MAQENDNAAAQAAKAAKNTAKKAAKTALKGAGPWGWAALGVLALYEGCKNFFGCFAQNVCILLMCIGVPGFILGLLANTGVI